MLAYSTVARGRGVGIPAYGRTLPDLSCQRQAEVAVAELRQLTTEVSNAAEAAAEGAAAQARWKHKRRSI